MGLITPGYFDKEFPKEIPFVDDWIPEEKDIIFKTQKGYIYTPIGDFYGLDDPNHIINRFYLSNKRSYNSVELREHICLYLNYFEKYFDWDKELAMIYVRMKYLIDYEQNYNKQAFIYDLQRYILHSDIFLKVDSMVRKNYSLNLVYMNKKNPVLQYQDYHAMVLLKISVLMNIMIPLLCEFMMVHQITDTTYFLLEIYDILLHMFPDVDIFNKLYETAASNVAKSREAHSILWDAQDIRGNNVTTHALNCVWNIIINIIPKYKFSENIIRFNYISILNNTAFQIVDISYEYSFVPLSSSKRDADQNSEFDRFESFITKTDESAYLLNKVNCESVMKLIELNFGPFNQDEINFYAEQLSTNGRFSINGFQKDLIFNLFYKYFGDPISIKAINRDDYIKLMISAKRILESCGMAILPYIVSGKVNRLVTRKNINKKELTKIESSPFYNRIKEKYKNPKVEKQILSIIAILLSSEFNIISYEFDELNGKKIECIPELICEEVLIYIGLI